MCRPFTRHLRRGFESQRVSDDSYIVAYNLGVEQLKISIFDIDFNRMKRLLLSLLLVAIGTSATAQHFFGMQKLPEHSGCAHGLEGTGIDAFSFVPPPAGFEQNGERSVVISVTYNGFTPAAQNAFQYAVDIWASLLTSNVPILVTANFTDLGPSILGSAGATTGLRNFPGALQPNTFYPVALANKLHDSDLAPGLQDITCSFSSSVNWYFGTDGNTPSGQYDFVTVVLHELCHGLGFFGTVQVDGSQASVGFLGSPFIYDTFVENGAGTELASLANPSAAVLAFATSNDLFWNGAEGVDANDGDLPELYAPTSFSPGSSISHLNEDDFPTGSVNALMTPFLGTAEAIHDPGAIVGGMLVDMGWEYGLQTCFGDFNDDGLVNSTDLLILLGGFGCIGVCLADLNGDSIVNATDSIIFLGAFGTLCD